MQHAIGEHALLADGRSAALVDPDGNVAWLCAPRVDSAPCLLSLLDEERGGRFLMRPASPGSHVVSRRYHAGSLVLETVWSIGAQRLTVDEAIGLHSGSLKRRVRAHGGTVDVDVLFTPAFDMGRTPAAWRIDGQQATATGAGMRLVAISPGGWRMEGDGTASSRVAVPDGHAGALITLHSGAEAGPASGDPIEATLASWRRRTGDASGLRIVDALGGLSGESGIRELLRTSIAVLVGLTQSGGGIVAAPTTSLPQWPGSARTWDYRYCWLRDSALAGRALLRAGLVEAASRIGAFLGGVIREQGPRPLVRIDGSPPPLEQLRLELRGYRDARPVRVGNAAVDQPQLDAPGEVLEMAWDLAAAGALPQALAAACRLLADWLAEHWAEPDHGIWEIRGAPRRYTHSRVMAAAGLEWAAALAERGLIRGDAARWARTARAVRASVAPPKGGALQLHDGGGGADAALSAVPLAGFLPPDDATVRRTLDLIAARLDNGGLLDRYEGQPDPIADPCAPFVFPAFWMAAAQRLCGGDAQRYAASALAARGPLGLWGEVADPNHGGPLGNYPQVQSHAAFMLAAIEP